MTPVSSIAARWELVARIKERRAEHSITGPVLAKELGFTNTYWSKVENEKKLLTPEKFERLLDFLEFPEQEREQLHALRENAVGSGWWSPYGKVHTPQYINWIGLEYGAEEVRSYESLLIPGLLQTEAYARALIEADQIGIPAKEVQRRIAVRMRRQERLFDRHDPLRFTAVISQAAVEQQFGGPQTLRDQLQHVVEVVEEYSDTIEVRVIPFTSRIGPIIGGCTFHILEFSNAGFGPLAWYESPIVDSVIEDADQVFDLSRLLQHAQDQALSSTDSLALIEEAVAGLK